MTIIITLSFAGNETGPFDLYSDADNFAVAFATNVAKADLLAGYQVNAPAGTTTVRLDDLSGLCLNTETDIYTCATPNCDFSGSIICDITTTTTTTPPPTTTTTTSYFPDPFGIPCLWSTNGGNSGSVAVYDFDTNTATDVLVPNDFTETVGIERPICATEDKLWLVSIVDEAGIEDYAPDNKVYIREWDIDATGVTPTLTYVREITVPIGQYPGRNIAGTSVWAMTAIDNNTLIVGTGYEDAPPPQEGTGGSGSVYLIEFSIAALGDITILPDDMSFVNAGVAPCGTCTSKLSNITYTNSGQVVVGYRIEGQEEVEGNYLIVHPVTPSNPEYDLNDQVVPPIFLQEHGFPAFSESYNGSKDAPFWGINGLAQVLHPETLEVYTMSQLIPNNLTFTTSVNSSNDWLSSATHCSNITFVSGDPNPNCGLTAFPNMFGSSQGPPDTSTYLGPQTFTYGGMTCTASLSGDLGAWFIAPMPGYFMGCSGLRVPNTEGELVLANTSPNNSQLGFNITIEFPVPVNNIPIRAGVLNSNEDGTYGDVYYVETNGGTPTLSINDGCRVQVDGNKLWGGVVNPNDPTRPVLYNIGDGEFIVTAPADYTTMTIFDNGSGGGQGGPLFLGCPPVNCENMIFVEQGGTTCTNPESAGRCVAPPIVPMDQTSYNKIFVWNKIEDTCTEIGPPPGAGFASGDVSIGDNIVVISAFYNNPVSPSIGKTFIKYDCTVTNGVPSNLQWDEKQYVLPTFWDDFAGTFIPNIEVINDNQIGVTVSDNVTAPCYQDVRFLICTFPETGEEMIVDEQFQLPCGHGDSGDIVITYKQDGITPNKLITLGGVEASAPSGVVVYKIAVSQYDIATGNLEVVTKAEDFIDPSGIAASLAIVDGELYAGSAVWAKVDWNPPYEWTILPDNESPCPAGGAGTTPGCRITDGFIVDDNTTTTTTSTTPNPGGTNTIWTRFESGATE